MKKYLMILAALAFGCMQVATAGGNLARQHPITVTMEMSEFAFSPAKLEFETGKLYKLILKNIGKIKHEIDSGALSHLAYTRKIQIMDGGDLVAEIKGSPAEIEVGPGREVEWWFVPIQTTDGPEEFVCLLEGHYESGMHGMITFK